jgi:hypothetical protein
MICTEYGPHMRGTAHVKAVYTNTKGVQDLHHPFRGNYGASLGVDIKERENAQNIPLGRSVSERVLI